MGVNASCSGRTPPFLGEGLGLAPKTQSRQLDTGCGCNSSGRMAMGGFFCGMGVPAVGSRDPLPRTTNKRRHLVLNMDVNKTVIMTDSVTGKSLPDVVNETLSNATWGEVVEGKWLIRSFTPAICRPNIELEGVVNASIISYAEWVNKAFPGSSNKKKRMAMNGTFTEVGRPGEKMRKYADAAMAVLRRPDGTDVKILPSFLELLAFLKREKRSFSLCFRTFGDDLSDLSSELNAFCEGKNPQFPDIRMDGSDGEADYRFDPTSFQQVGTFHRDKNTISLIMGTTDQAGEGRHKEEKDKSLRFYRSMRGVRIYVGFDAVKRKLDSLYQRCGTTGLRDYFAHWKERKMTSDGGKLFLYNPSRSTNQHELFFDDNIHFSDCYIVHPIDVTAPDRKHWVVPLLQTHLCRAEPLESIPDAQWFVKAVQRLEEGYERKLCARERLRALLQQVTMMKKQDRLNDMLLSLAAGPDFDPWQNFRHTDNELSLCQADGEDSAELF